MTTARDKKVDRSQIVLNTYTDDQQSSAVFM